MKIIEKSRELTIPELYQLTMSPEIGKISEIAGTVLEIDCFVLYEDAGSDGTINEILSIKTLDGEVRATNSPTFIREFMRMQDLFTSNGEKVEKVKVINGTSKAGRTFFTCTYTM